jgi:hypothetical protein
MKSEFHIKGHEIATESLLTILDDEQKKKKKPTRQLN